MATPAYHEVFPEMVPYRVGDVVVIRTGESTYSVWIGLYPYGHGQSSAVYFNLRDARRDADRIVGRLAYA